MKMQDNSNSNYSKRIADSFNNKQKNNNHGIKKSHSRKTITQEIFEYGTDKKIPFNVIRSKRRKTSELIIENENEITLRVPFAKPIEEIKEIIHKKLHWILKKQKEYQDIESKQEIVKPVFKEWTTLPYLGKNYTILIRTMNNHDKNNKKEIQDIRIKDDKIYFLVKTESEKNNTVFIKRIYQNWLKEQASILFEKKVQKNCKELGFEFPKKIVIKDLKNRWGSLTEDNIMNLNVNLMKAPEDIIDYIIVHELCHTKIKEHFHGFWKFLQQFEPEYAKKSKWLETNSKNLIE